MQSDELMARVASTGNTVNDRLLMTSTGDQSGDWTDFMQDLP